MMHDDIWNFSTISYVKTASISENVFQAWSFLNLNFFLIFAN